MEKQADNSDLTQYKDGIPLVVNDDTNEDDDVIPNIEEVITDVATPTVSKTLLSEEVPNETIERFESILDNAYRVHGHLFKTRNDCDYFTMLPIAKAQKKEILQRAIQYEKKQLETIKV